MQSVKTKDLAELIAANKVSSEKLLNENQIDSKVNQVQELLKQLNQKILDSQFEIERISSDISSKQESKENIDTEALKNKLAELEQLNAEMQGMLDNLIRVLPSDDEDQ